MSKELIKAAQQALDALKTCSEHLAGTRFKHKEFNTDKVGKARSTLERALTQRPAAQEVASEARELAHNMMLWREDARMHGSEYVPVHVRTLDNLIAQLRGLLAPQQATPERHLTVTTNQQGEAVMVSW